MPSGVRRFALAISATIGITLAGAATAWAGSGGFLPNADSPNADRIRHAYIFVAVFTGVIFVLVEGTLITFIVKYRRGKRAKTTEGPQIHGSSRLEIIWTVLPAVILAVIGAFIFYELPGIDNAPNAAA